MFYILFKRNHVSNGQPLADDHCLTFENREDFRANLRTMEADKDFTVISSGTSYHYCEVA